MGDPTLFLMCGLPGSGKTTEARLIEAARHAVRLAPDDWLRALGRDLFDEENRDRVEALQWQLALRLLRLGQSVILEPGSGRAPSAMRSGVPPGRSGQASNCVISMFRWKNCSGA